MIYPRFAVLCWLYHSVISAIPQTVMIGTGVVVVETLLLDVCMRLMNLLSPCHRPKTRPYRAILLFGALVLAMPGAATTALGGTSAQPLGESSIRQSALERQRLLYQRAEEALGKQQTTTYTLLAAQLTDYPLFPYLRFAELRSRLAQASDAEIQGMLKQYADFPQTLWLREEWLARLAGRGDWQGYLRDLPADASGMRLRCLTLRARFHTGQEQEVLAAMPDLWRTGESLPGACDPLLELWRMRGGLTDTHLWERLELAVQAGNDGLIRYLQKELPPAQRKQAEQLQKVHKNPTLVTDTTDFRSDDPRTRSIIALGMTRYARQSPEEASALWERYLKSHRFSDDQQARVKKEIGLMLAVRYHPDAARWLERGIPLQQDDPQLQEWRMRLALRAGQWEDVIAQYERLSPALKESPRWKYWKARALEMRGDEANDRAAIALYGDVARERDYYGFLAADRIGATYNVNDGSLKVTGQALARVAGIPGIRRAEELYRMGKLVEARREWRFTTRRLPVQDTLTAAHLAQQWGWTGQGVMSVIDLKAWDELALRFPIAYKEQFTNETALRQLDVNWVMALARQESAFIPDARSPKGALGLLQLLPTTAAQTARQQGIEFAGARDLLNPNTNIRLGAAHLSELLERFNQNRILATAAYNAGSARVVQWLDNGGDALPYDVWVETMPYYETRQYVQNVLAYSIIYGYRRGDLPKRLLTEREVACVCLPRP